MSTHDQPNEKSSVLEELTAYLDGELDEVSRQRVETRLGSDPDYLAEMQGLQQTWDMLDRLPTTEPGGSFTQTTMELIVNEAKRQSQKGFSWFWPARILLVTSIFAGLFGISFGYFRMLQTQPDRILIQNLPVIENSDRYDAVDLDIRFVEQLLQLNLFPKVDLQSLENSAVTGQLQLAESTGRRIPDSPEARIEWLNSLDVEQKSKLKNKLDAFVQLSDSRRQELLAFQEQLSKHPDREDLEFVLHEFYEWLKTIDVGARSRLLDHTTDERIRAIADLRESQAREAFDIAADELPSTEDADTIFHWFLGLINAKGELIRNHFPDAVTGFRTENDLRRLPPNIVDRLAQRGQLNQLVDYLMEIDAPFVESIVMEDSAVQVLYTLLTPKAKAILLEQSDEGRRELIFGWVQLANRAFYRVSQERLKRFAESLPASERDELDQLSSKTYLVRLKELYRQKNLPSLQSNDPAAWRKLYELSLPRNDTP